MHSAGSFPTGGVLHGNVPLRRTDDSAHPRADPGRGQGRYPVLLESGLQQTGRFTGNLTYF